MRGIEPRAFHMQSERSTTELHPRQQSNYFRLYYFNGSLWESVFWVISSWVQQSRAQNESFE